MKRSLIAFVLTMAWSTSALAQTQFIAPYSGAVSRTNNSKMADIVSVFDFIPVSLQAAIKAGTSTTDVSSYLAAMQAAVPAGVTFLFPPGQYNIGAGSSALTSRVIYAAGVTFTGGGSITGATFVFNTTDGRVSLAGGGLGGSQAGATVGQIPIFPGSGGAAVPTSFLNPGTNSVARTWNSKVSDTINIADFGASTGNSGAANTIDFSDTLTRSTAVFSGYTIGGGTFSLDSWNTLTGAPLVQGQGITQTTLQWSAGHSSGNFAVIGNGAYQTGTTIKDINIDANASAQSVGAGGALTIDTEFLVTLDNVGVANAPTSAINVHGTAAGLAYFGGLNMRGGQVLNWAQTAPNTSPGMQVGPYIYAVTVSGGTEFAGGPTTSEAAIKVSNPGNHSIFSNLNLDSNAQAQMLVTAAPWVFGSDLFIHTGGSVTSTQEGILANAASQQLAFANNQFFNIPSNDYHFDSVVHSTITGGTSLTNSSRAQSILLHDSSYIGISNFDAQGTFSVGSIVETGTSDYNSIVGGIGSVVKLGAHSKVVGRIGSDEYLGPINSTGTLNIKPLIATNATISLNDGSNSGSWSIFASTAGAFGVFDATTSVNAISIAQTSDIVTIPNGLVLGVQQTTAGQIVLANTAAGAFATTLQSSNSATAAYTLTFPPAAPSGNGYAFVATTGGVGSWENIGTGPFLPLAGGTMTGGIGFSTTNTLDIGTNATTLAPRNVYAGTSFSGPAGVFTTSTTSPLFIGGSGTTGTQLTFKTTTGNGTTDQFLFEGGNNGGTAFGTWAAAGLQITSAGSTAFAVGRQGGSTGPAFSVDAAAGTQTAGLKVVGAALNGTVGVVVTDTSGNTNLTINALGSGTIGIGTDSTGIVTIKPATNIAGLLTASTGMNVADTYTYEYNGAAFAWLQSSTGSLWFGSAGNASGTGADNIGIGPFNLVATTSGGYNTAVGGGALQHNTTGGSNMAVGYGSLGANIAGGNNTAIGVNALAAQNNSAANNNVAVGNAAGNANISGGGNTFVGHDSGQGVTTGSNNTVIGGGISLASAAANQVVISDGAAQARFDYGFTTASTNTITGTLAVTAIASASGNDILCYTTSGGLITYASSVVGCVPSAMRLKNMDGVFNRKTALAGIMAVDVGIYSYKTETGLDQKEMIGLYADQICKIDARLCHWDAEGQIDNYDKVGALAIAFAGIQQLKADNDNLRGEINEIRRMTR